MSWQKWIACGHLGADPEARYTPSGTAVTSFSLATSRRWKDQAGATQERTSWMRCVAMGKLAEVAANYLKKGSKVLIAGTVENRKYQGSDGSDKYITECFVTEIDLQDKKPDDGGQRDYSRQDRQQTRQAPPQSEPEFDDDIPF